MMGNTVFADGPVYKGNKMTTRECEQQLVELVDRLEALPDDQYTDEAERALIDACKKLGLFEEVRRETRSPDLRLLHCHAV